MYIKIKILQTWSCFGMSSIFTPNRVMTQHRVETPGDNPRLFRFLKYLGVIFGVYLIIPRPLDLH